MKSIIMKSNIEGVHDMSKTKEELNALKEEVETVNEKLHELTEEELEKVTGGARATSSRDGFQQQEVYHR